MSDLLSLIVIAIFMSISPGADFMMVTRNSLVYGRKAGLFSSLGVGTAIWIHVCYSIAGIALIIANSLLLFSLIKYAGAAYLIYLGWKTMRSRSPLDVTASAAEQDLSAWAAFRIGFMTNALNPKTTLFFLSIFTQLVDSQTPLIVQIGYGAIISLAHLLWFSLVSMLFTQRVLLEKFKALKNRIETCLGIVLIGFGLKLGFSALQP